MKTTTTFLSLTAFAFLAAACTDFDPREHPDYSLSDEAKKQHYDDSSLNAYGDTLGSLVQGETYRYTNSKTRPTLNFTVARLLSEREALFVRQGTMLYVFSAVPYAERSTLNDGEYVCIGTYRYTTLDGEERTVYAVADKLVYEKREDATKTPNSAPRQ